MTSNINGQTASEKRAAISAARKDAHAFRGAFLDRYARLEQALAPVLALASMMPEYSAVAGKPPHLFGQKIALLRRIAETKGPLRSSLANVTIHIDDLKRYDETRAFMSHAVVEIAKTERDETLYIFRMARLAKGHCDQATLTIVKDEAPALTKHVGAIVNVITRQLDTVGKKCQRNVVPLPAVTARSA